jgi:hypothetical protein
MKNFFHKKNPIRALRRKIREYLFFRNKRALFDVNVDVVYDDSEFRDRDRRIYGEYAEALIEVFDPKEIIDIGCANGYLLEYLAKKGITKFTGLEGADAAFKYMPAVVKSKAFKVDLSKKVDVLPGQKFHIVNCTEIGEHIPAKYEDIFIGNISGFVDKYLILSWANTWEDWHGVEKQKHVNPRSKRYVINKLKKLGLIYRKSLTDSFIRSLNKKQNVFDHWARNMMVFERVRNDKQ